MVKIFTALNQRFVMFKRSLIVLLLICLSSIPVFVSTNAFASGEENLIATCDELAALDTDANAYDDEIYLTDDLFCSLTVFDPLEWGVNQFEGVIYGNGHTIYDLTINQEFTDNVAMFENTDGAAFIDFFIQDAEMTGANNVGTIVGEAANTTFENVHVTTDVHGSAIAIGGFAGALLNSSIVNSSVRGEASGGAQIGGLAGWAYSEGGTTSISGSWSDATITGGSYSVGGLLGQLSSYATGGSIDSVSTVSDSYATGDVNSPGANTAGGLIGQVFIRYGTADSLASASITRTYSSGDVIGNDRVGGITGYLGNLESEFNTLYIEDNFAIGSVTGANAGAIVGDTEATDHPIFFDNNYFDSVTTTKSDCASDLSLTVAECANADAADYIGSVASEPVATWFTDSSQWIVPAESLPNVTQDIDFDGISTYSESIGPNSGDVNNDGTPDFKQANIATFYPPSDIYQSVEVSTGTLINVADETYAGEELFEFPLGLMSFVVRVSEGTSVDVTLRYFTDMAAEDFVPFKHGVNNELVEMLDAVVTETTIDGDPVIQVTYTIVDGGAYDQDETVNGRIIDPIGLGQALPVQQVTTTTQGPIAGNGSGSNVIAAPNSASGTLPSTGSNALDVIFYALTISALGAGLFLLVRKRLEAQSKV